MRQNNFSWMFGVAGLLLSLSASAAREPAGGNIALQLRLRIDGKLISTAKVQTTFGAKTLLEQRVPDKDSTYSIETTPIRKGKYEVLVKCRIRRSENGHTEYMGSPKIIVLNHQSAIMSQPEDEYTSAFELTIIPSF